MYADVSRCADVSTQSASRPIESNVLSDVADDLSHTAFVAEQMDLSRQIDSVIATMGEEAAMAGEEGEACHVHDVVVV